MGKPWWVWPLVGILGGCLVGIPSPVPSRFSPPSQVIQIPGVPFHGGTQLACGPASLAMVLEFWGVAVDEAVLTRVLVSRDWRGTLNLDLPRVARAYLGGRPFQVEVLWDRPEVLWDALTAGHPLLVLVDRGVGSWRRGHYLVVWGWNPETQTLLVHSPPRPAQTVSLSRFLHQWRRAYYWALRIQPLSG